MKTENGFAASIINIIPPLGRRFPNLKISQENASGPLGIHLLGFPKIILQKGK